MKLRQGLDLEQADDEDDAEKDPGDRDHVEDAAETFPSFALGVVEDRFVRGVVDNAEPS